MDFGAQYIGRHGELKYAANQAALDRDQRFQELLMNQEENEKNRMLEREKIAASTKNVALNKLKHSTVQKFLAGDRSEQTMADMATFAATEPYSTSIKMNAYGDGLEQVVEPGPMRQLWAGSGMGSLSQAPTSGLPQVAPASPQQYTAPAPQLTDRAQVMSNLAQSTGPAPQTMDFGSLDNALQVATGEVLPQQAVVQPMQPMVEPNQRAQASPKTQIEAAKQKISTGGAMAEQANQAHVNLQYNRLDRPDELKHATAKELDKMFITEIYAPYVRGEGSDTMKQLDQLNHVVAALESGQDLTGSLFEAFPRIVRAFENPEGLNTQELVEEVVQRNLRVILGAQFTEKEGERLIARAYNPLLDEAVNVRRVRRLMDTMRLAAEQRASAIAYFEDNGTLNGWKGLSLKAMQDAVKNADLGPTKQVPNKYLGKVISVDGWTGRVTQDMVY